MDAVKRLARHAATAQPGVRVGPPPRRVIEHRRHLATEQGFGDLLHFGIESGLDLLMIVEVAKVRRELDEIEPVAFNRKFAAGIAHIGDRDGPWVVHDAADRNAFGRFDVVGGRLWGVLVDIVDRCPDAPRHPLAPCGLSTSF